MTATIEMLIVRAADEGQIVTGEGRTFTVDGRPTDIDLQFRIAALVDEGLLAADREVPGSRVQPTDAGWGLFR